MHEILAIKIYSSDLIYKQLNLDIRSNKYSKWKPFLKCLIDSIRKCNYYIGIAYRGVRDYQDLNFYSKGRTFDWKPVSSMSKNIAVSEKFCNSSGTLFIIDLISAKDIAQLSVFPDEEEVIMLPFSYFITKDIEIENGQAVKVYLKELPFPRFKKFILWVEYQSYSYPYQLEKENKDVSVVFCKSIWDSFYVLKQYKWIQQLEGSHFRIVLGKEEIFEIKNRADDLFYHNRELEQNLMVFCAMLKRLRRIAITGENQLKYPMIQLNYINSQDFNDKLKQLKKININKNRILEKLYDYTLQILSIVKVQNYLLQNENAQIILSILYKQQIISISVIILKLTVLQILKDLKKYWIFLILNYLYK